MRPAQLTPENVFAAVLRQRLDLASMRPAQLTPENLAMITTPAEACDASMRPAQLTPENMAGPSPTVPRRTALQ